MAFNNKNNVAKTTPTNSNPIGKINQVVEGTVFEGNIVSDSNFRIDGKIIGKITIQGKLVLGPKGVIEGEIICENAEIEGFFKGDIRVKSFLSLKSTAQINGDIYTQKIAVEPGAEFTGKCIMSDQPLSQNNNKNNSSVSSKQEAVA